MGLVMGLRYSEEVIAAKEMVSGAELEALDQAEALCQSAERLMQDSAAEAAETRRAAAEAAEEIVEAARERAADLLRRTLVAIRQSELETEAQCERMRADAQQELDAAVAFRRQSMKLLHEVRRTAGSVVDLPIAQPLAIDLRQLDEEPLAV
jgi:hypothetical protein